MNSEKPTQEDLNNWNKDPKNWFGPFYFNKEDKRFFVQKRVAWMGFTLNFGNTIAVLTIIALLFFLYSVRRYQ
ncbi:DUF5808 domain-containing protein [Flavobacterium geliluteum]|uniref:DUF5808 domain-containing protein n=1 Tax=Flavobacterium geliluteum TaxID=2816120 RepID=A0A940X853_9FLAO|nr:DUF5808 domain-containing protein [Flavobacterium geliluteum]MBP4137851.1 hypothetical protein [Flavobacterium geliluteum]